MTRLNLIITPGREPRQTREFDAEYVAPRVIPERLWYPGYRGPFGAWRWHWTIAHEVSRVAYNEAIRA